jgi:hypothetical protein
LRQRAGWRTIRHRFRIAGCASKPAQAATAPAGACCLQWRVVSRVAFATSARWVRGRDAHLPELAADADAATWGPILIHELMHLRPDGPRGLLALVADAYQDYRLARSGWRHGPSPPTLISRIDVVRLENER